MRGRNEVRGNGFCDHGSTNGEVRESDAGGSFDCHEQSADPLTAVSFGHGVAGDRYPLTVVGQKDELKIPCLTFLFNELRVQASIVAPRVILKRILDLAAFHGVGAVVSGGDTGGHGGIEGGEG